jgi:hypothetical protein
MLGFRWKWRRQDLIWIFIIIIIILFLVVASLIVILVKDKSGASDYLSFAANFSSIILAVVAIVYAFFQTIQSSNQGALVQKTLQDINKEVIKLTDIKNDVLILRENGNTQENRITTIFSSGIEELKGEIKNMLVPQDNTPENSQNNEKMNEILQKIEILEQQVKEEQEEKTRRRQIQEIIYGSKSKDHNIICQNSCADQSTLARAASEQRRKRLEEIANKNSNIHQAP